MKRFSGSGSNSVNLAAIFLNVIQLAISDTARDFGYCSVALEVNITRVIFQLNVIDL